MNNSLEVFGEMLKTTSVQKFLRANPFTKTDGVDFDGCISQDMFFDCFYASSQKAENLLNDISNEVKDNPESTIIIQGYSGCGKTTFLHYILYTCFPNSSIIDFEIGIDNTQEDPVRQKIQYIICENISHDIIFSQAVTLRQFYSLFCINYINNHAITTFLDNNFKLRKVTSRIIGLLDHFSHQLSDEDKVTLMETVDTCLSSLDVVQILTFYVLWDIANKVADNKKIGNLFCFDNLDNIDIDKAKKFVKYFSQFWVNLINAFSRLIIPNNSNLRLVEQYSFILSLRETTYAKLTEHFNENNAKAVLSEFSLNNIYSQKSIITKRAKFLKDRKESLTNCENLCAGVYEIEKLMRNEYIENNIFSLFNNSYSIAIKTLSSINHKYPQYIAEYNRIVELKIKKFNRGANAIILSMFFNFFKGEGFFDKNLQLYDFSREENQKYLFSPARLILTYLSNARSACSIYTLLKDFEGIIDKSDIIDIVDKLYLLRYSTWRHLITFDKYPPSEQSELDRQLVLFEQGLPKDDSRYSTFEITSAGRVFLKTIASHFEFYATRLMRGRSRPLFDKSNLELDAKGEYRFQTIIEKVYHAVLNCCQRLKTADDGICKTKNWTISQLYVSEFVYKDPDRRTRQFHGERLIFNHIGYINIYRQYLLTLTTDIKIKTEWNKILVDYIDEYLKIYEGNNCTKSPLNAEVAIQLREQIDRIITNDYSDFETLIETEDYIRMYSG